MDGTKHAGDDRRVEGAGDKDSEAFADTPTALKTMFGRLDDWLRLRPTKPAVTNPFLPSENFADGWTDEQYENFRNKINSFSGARRRRPSASRSHGRATTARLRLTTGAPRLGSRGSGGQGEGSPL